MVRTIYFTEIFAQQNLLVFFMRAHSLILHFAITPEIYNVFLERAEIIAIARAHSLAIAGSMVFRALVFISLMMPFCWNKFALLARAAKFAPDRHLGQTVSVR
jgi:hypothetical protein